MASKPGQRLPPSLAGMTTSRLRAFIARVPHGASQLLHGVKGLSSQSCAHGTSHGSVRLRFCLESS